MAIRPVNTNFLRLKPAQSPLRGLNDLHARNISAKANSWSRDLYPAIQHILRLTKDGIIDQRTKIRNVATWNYFQRFACRAKTADDRELVISTLFNMIKIHDKYTAIHCIQTRDWAISIACQLGFHQKEIDAIGVAAYLHDLGKIGVPRNILQKQGGLNKEEMSHIREVHVTFGYSLLKDCGWANDILEMIKYHHYIKSYPQGIEPGKAPVGARILAVADSVEAATAGRVYEKEKTLKTVLRELRVIKNNYDQDVVDAFEILIKKPR